MGIDIENKCPKCKSDKVIHDEEDPFSTNEHWECLVCGYVWENKGERSQSSQASSQLKK